MTTAHEARYLPDRGEGALARTLLSWEALLVFVACFVFVLNSFASPYFLDPWNLSDATFNFTEKAMIAFAMTLVIVSGEIDLSVASTIALCSVAMGAVAETGAGVPLVVGTGLLTGLFAGAFNGALVAGLGLPSIVVTIGTLSLYRGLAYVALGDGVYKNYPSGFAEFGQGYVWWVFTWEMVAFVLFALVFGFLLHRTVFGRWVFAIGNNPVGARFSGIRVQRVKFVLFLLTGLMSAVASVFLTSRLGSTRPSIAFGWELEIVTMIVLGGVAIMGGAGSVLGVAIAAVVMGLITFGLGLLNVPGIVMQIFVGGLLIAVVALPNLLGALRRRRARAGGAA